MDKASEKLTELSSLGEFGLIDRLTKNIRLHENNTIMGVGDDCAVYRSSAGLSLLSTDLLVEGVHFDLMYHPIKHLGYKAAVVNFSDIAAMNGRVRQLAIGLAISSRFSLEALDELYAGIRLACERYEVDLVGGDTVSSLKGMFLSVSVVGDVEENQVTYRHGAKSGDLLCVTGDLGAAYLGLLLLEREKQVYRADPGMQPLMEGYDYILERILKPEARTDMMQHFRKAGIRPTSMIDISDGLASEIIHLCKASKSGAAIYDNKIPIDPASLSAAELFNINPLTAALHGGEDYELLFTVSQGDYEKVNDLPGVSIIGHMTDPSEGIRLIGGGGHVIELTAQGWDAFK